MNNLKTPTCDQKVVVYCKDNHELIGEINIIGYERFSDYYKKADNLDMYNVKVYRHDKQIFESSYLCVEKYNIIFAAPLEDENI